MQENVKKAKEKEKFTINKINVTNEAKSIKSNKLFKYEKKLWKIQKPDYFKIIIATFAQMLHGLAFPCIYFILHFIYVHI